MKVVLDTNVLISALINPTSVPAKVIDLIEAKTIQLAMSIATHEELCRMRGLQKNTKTLALTPPQEQELAEQMMIHCQLIYPDIAVMAIAEDESDNRYIEVALAAKDSYVITGDQHLLKLEKYNGTEMVTPAQFLWQMDQIAAEMIALSKLKTK